MVVLKEECGSTVGEVETFSLGLISDKDNSNMNTSENKLKWGYRNKAGY